MLVDSVAAVPPAGAAVERVRVQVVDAFGPMFVGLQDSDGETTGATRVTFALTEVLNVAVIVAV